MATLYPSDHLGSGAQQSHKTSGSPKAAPKSSALRKSYNLLLPSSAEALVIVMIGLGSVPNVEPNHGEMQKSRSYEKALTASCKNISPY